MIKKIIFTFLLGSLLVSCGKKGYPEYKDPKQKTEMMIILTNKA
jgi:hypothetical protein